MTKVVGDMGWDDFNFGFSIGCPILLSLNLAPFPLLNPEEYFSIRLIKMANIQKRFTEPHPVRRGR